MLYTSKYQLLPISTSDLPGANNNMTDVDILTEALDITTGDRHDEYGDCNVELDRVATMWSVIFESDVTPNQVALAMIALKLTRQMHTNKRDNWVDIAGYARVGNLVNNQK